MILKYTVKYTKQFSKDLKRINKQGLDLSELEKVIDMLKQGQTLPLKYKEHVLSGKYSGCHECHIRPDWLLIWEYFDDVLVISLLRTGSHSKLFNK